MTEIICLKTVNCYKISILIIIFYSLISTTKTISILHYKFNKANNKIMEEILYFEKFLKPFCALALIIGLSFSVSAADYNLRMTMNSNDQDEDYDGSIVFKNYVESASNGAVSVELFVGTQLCSKGAECLQGVSDGSIDIYISTSGGAAGVFPYVQVLDLPYLMSDDRVAEDVMQSDFVRNQDCCSRFTSGSC